MITVPTISQLSQFSGRPESSYTSYAESALLQACLQFTIITELGSADYQALSPDDKTLATQGILAYADWVYLRQPYQSAIANPLESETIGSYTYSKPPPVEMRNVQAQELGLSMTGIPLWDLAVQMLSKRTRASGVFYGQMKVFDVDKSDRDGVTLVRKNKYTGELELLGPSDFDQIDIPSFAINAEAFPGDPGVG